MFDNYLLRRKNARYDLNSEIDPLWGGIAGTLSGPMILGLMGRVLGQVLTMTNQVSHQQPLPCFRAVMSWIKPS